MRICIAALIAVSALTGCVRAGPSSPAPKRITQAGTASWYGPGFHGKTTTSGEIYDQKALTAAHRTFPLGTRVRVTNVATEKSVEVRINDRGPFVGDRIIDLSFGAASLLGMIGPGTADVMIEVLETPTPITAVPTAVRYAVQVGSYSSRDAAEAARDRVSKSAHDVTVATAKAGRQDLYRVRVGDFADINDARAEAQRLKRAGVEGIVVER
jgi:rare lipoprotein A